MLIKPPLNISIISPIVHTIIHSNTKKIKTYFMSNKFYKYIDIFRSYFCR